MSGGLLGDAAGGCTHACYETHTFDWPCSQTVIHERTDPMTAPRDPGRPEPGGVPKLRTPEQDRRRARRVDRAIAWLVAAAAALVCFAAGYVIGNDDTVVAPEVWCCRVVDANDVPVSTPTTTTPVPASIDP